MTTDIDHLKGSLFRRRRAHSQLYVLNSLPVLVTSCGSRGRHVGLALGCGLPSPVLCDAGGGLALAPSEPVSSSENRA